MVVTGIVLQMVPFNAIDVRGLVDSYKRYLLSDLQEQIHQLIRHREERCMAAIK